jgi:cytochrome o ubiquinol oxidase operon protein cyoD
MEWNIFYEEYLMPQHALTLRIIGYVGSLLLTLIAFFIIANADSLQWKVGGAILTLFILAVLQFLMQFVFFLDLWREKRPRWNLFIFFSTMSIVLIIILASIWIMDHLDYNMMPMHESF